MTFSVALYLAFKELWRNRGRFLLVSMVIALITLLVIFLAGLGEGLATANKEYLSNLGGELVVFQDQANLAVLSSQIAQVFFVGCCQTFSQPSQENNQQRDERDHHTD